MRFVVVGAGAIGGTVGAHLARGGEDVTFVDADPAHVRAIRERGLALETPEGRFVVRAPAFEPGEVRGPLGVVLLAVGATETERALRALLPHLAAGSFVVSLQNGLNEPLIAGLVGSQRTVGAFINFSAEYLEPGQVRFWGTGPFFLGELDGSASDRVQRLASVLTRHWGPVAVTDNIYGYLWAKEAYTNMIMPCRLVDADQADACERRPALMIELATEFIAVAARAGIRLQGFNGFRPSLYHPRERRRADALQASYAEMVEYMRRRQKPRPGSYRRVPGQGLPAPRHGTEWRLEQAARHGLDLPLTRLAAAAVESVADGPRPGWQAMDRLADQAAAMYG